MRNLWKYDFFWICTLSCYQFSLTNNPLFTYLVIVISLWLFAVIILTCHTKYRNTYFDPLVRSISKHTITLPLMHWKIYILKQERYIFAALHHTKETLQNIDNFTLLNVSSPLVSICQIIYLFLGSNTRNDEMVNGLYLTLSS